MYALTTQIRFGAAVTVGAQEMRKISLSGTLGRVAWHLLGLNLRVGAAVALALARQLVSALRSLPCCVASSLALGSREVSINAARQGLWTRWRVMVLSRPSGRIRTLRSRKCARRPCLPL